MSINGKTRLSCRIVRLRDAMTGSRASGHLAHCADCQAYYRTVDSFTDQLRATAPHASKPVSEEFAARIANAVRQSAPARSPRRSRSLEAFAVLAGAAAVFAFSFYLVRPGSIPHSKPSAIAKTNPAELTTLVAGVDSLRNRLIDSVEPAAESLVTKNPISQEIDSVKADARSALGFLALNFLPSDSARQIESRIVPSRS